MPKHIPTSMDIEFMTLFIRLSDELGRVPTTSELARESNVVDSAISNRKKRLKQKGYLDPVLGVLTASAMRFMNTHPTVRQIHIPLLGTVSAGKRTQDELVVNMSTVTRGDLRNSALPAISIPAIQNYENVFALRVDGISMEDEKIIAGDSIFVQPFENGAFPSEGDLIVVKYLPLFLTTFNANWDFSDIADEDFAGPTLKYFYQKENNRYRLSMRKGFNDNPFTIETQYVKPIGKVVGMWRSF